MLAGAQAQTLGYRKIAPAGFDQNRLKELAETKREGGPKPPTNWTTWTRNAKVWLREQNPTQARGNRGRGRGPVFRKQTSSRPQFGDGAYGANARIKRLRLKEERAERLEQLTTKGLQDTFEGRRLRQKLQEQPPVTAAEQEELDQWTRLSEARRKKRWTGWANEHIFRGGGKLYRWAQRTTAHDQLTNLTASQQGEDCSVAAKLEGQRSLGQTLARRQRLATNHQQPIGGHYGRPGRESGQRHPLLRL